MLRVSHEFLRDKFIELILYVAKRSQKDPRFGSVKLNKVLYYADTRAYLELGSPITGATYQHLQEGPAPTALVPVRAEMIAAGDAELEARRYLTRTQQRLVALREPDLSLFAQTEIGIVDEVIADLWELDANGVSTLSHQEWGWRLTDLGEPIPIRTAWLSPDPLDEFQVAQGQELWQSLYGESGAV
jgi:hypothetical protein